MTDIPLFSLFIALAVLIVLSGFFSSSETAMMSLNRFRLRHLANRGSRSALRAQRLLGKPDRLIGLILLANNFVNILASALATVAATQLMGEAGVLVATVLLTLIILIFAEVTPKTLAAYQPERVALPAAYVLLPLMRVLYPFVWTINTVANVLLRLARVPTHPPSGEQLDREELRVAVTQSSPLIPVRHQDMLLNILDLEEATVEDVMVPRNEIVGLDLAKDWQHVVRDLTRSYYTRLPVYRERIDNVIGVLHVRAIVPRLAQGEISEEELLRALRKPYFVPESTRLTRQLLEFQDRERRLGLVVDEYGDIQGLLTLDDILEEIVGEFTTEPLTRSRNATKQPDGSYIVDGSARIRMLNRRMGWELPTEGARTLNGLILEILEAIPEPGTSVEVDGMRLTIEHVRGNFVNTVRIKPQLTEATDDVNGAAGAGETEP